MQFSEILEKIMEQRHITAYKLWKDTKIPQSVIGRWKAGTAMPSTENLSILSNYFGVSADYLLGKEEAKKPTTEKIDDGLMDKFREKIMRLTPSQRQLLEAHMDLMLQSHQKE